MIGALTYGSDEATGRVWASRLITPAAPYVLKMDEWVLLPPDLTPRTEWCKPVSWTAGGEQKECWALSNIYERLRALNTKSKNEEPRQEKAKKRLAPSHEEKCHKFCMCSTCSRAMRHRLQKTLWAPYFNGLEEKLTLVWSGATRGVDVCRWFTIGEEFHLHKLAYPYWRGVVSPLSYFIKMIQKEREKNRLARAYAAQHPFEHLAPEEREKRRVEVEEILRLAKRTTPPMKAALREYFLLGRELKELVKKHKVNARSFSKALWRIEKKRVAYDEKPN